MKQCREGSVEDEDPGEETLDELTIDVTEFVVVVGSRLLSLYRHEVMVQIGKELEVNV